MLVPSQSDSQQKDHVKVPSLLQTDALVQIFRKTAQLMLGDASISKGNGNHVMFQEYLQN